MVSLLGPPVVTLDGVAVKLPRRKVVALLAYLAVTARPHSRDTLAELFYPDHDRERAYSDLRQTLSSLRRALGARWVRADRSAVAMEGGRDLHVDVRDLRAAAADDAPARAVTNACTLVRGRFMEGFSLPDCPGFDEWQQREGDAVRRESVAVLGRQAMVHEKRSEVSAALALCSRLLEIDPLDEGTYRRVMRLHALGGRKAEALSQFERFRALLERELGEKPGPETEELRRQIAEGKATIGRLAGSPPSGPAASLPGPPSGSARPFFGRREELREGRAFLRDTRSGRGGLLLFVGDVGVGKTRLTEELVAAPEARGMRVAWARAHDRGGVPPYWPWRQVLDALARDASPEDLRRWLGSRESVLAAVREPQRLEEPPGGAAGSAESGRFLLIEAIARFIASASASAPVLIVLEDLHWADGGSLDVLEYLSHELAGEPVAVLASSRPVDADSSHPLSLAMGDLVRARGFRRMEIGPLDRDSAARLAVSAAGRRLAPPLLDALWEKTRGNPLFLVGMAQEPRLPDGAPIPASIRAVILRQVDRLSPACRKLITVAAALEAHLEIDLLARATGLLVTRVDELLHEAVSGGVLAPSDLSTGRFRFSHTLVQETISGELQGARRAEVHEAIAAALEATGSPDPIEIAFHLEQARTLVEPARLATACLGAGDQALAVFDYVQARHLYELGLDAKGPVADRESARLSFGAACSMAPPLMFFQVQRTSDRGPASPWTRLVQAFEILRDSGDREGAARVAALPLMFVDPSDGQRKTLFAEALGLAPPGSAVEAQLHLDEALEAIWGDEDVALARSRFMVAWDEARAVDDLRLSAIALSGLSWFAIEDEDMAELESRVAAAEALVRRIDDPVLAFNVQIRAYHVAMIRGNLPEAERQILVSEAAAQRLRDSERTLLVALLRVELARCRGDWEAMRAASDTALAAPRDSVLGVQHAALRGWFELELGNEQVARHWRGVVLSEIARRGTARDLATAVVIGPLAHFGWLAGDDEVMEASRRAARAWFPSGSEDEVLPGAEGRPQAASGFRFLAAVNGDRRAAESSCRFLDRIGPRSSVPGLEVTWDEGRGLLAGVLGDHDAAVAHLGATRDFFRTSGMRTLDGWACYELADALIARSKAGDLAAARTAIAEGRAIARDLGLKALQQKLAGLVVPGKR